MMKELLMSKLVLTLACFLLFNLPCYAQRLTVEQGRLEELRGVTRFHIVARVATFGRDSASADGENMRRNVMSIIKEKLPQIEFTDSLAQAEITLSVTLLPAPYDERGRLLVEEPSSGASTTNTPAPGNSGGDFRAQGEVVKYVNSRPTLRMSLYQDKVVEARRDILLERVPGTAFAQAFVKAYLKANEIKK